MQINLRVSEEVHMIIGHLLRRLISNSVVYSFLLNTIYVISFTRKWVIDKKVKLYLSSLSRVINKNVKCYGYCSLLNTRTYRQKSVGDALT